MANYKKTGCVKPPVGTICLQAGLLIYCAVLVMTHFDSTIFGMPLESFLVIWCPYVFVAIATAVYIYQNKDRKD